MSKNKRKSKSSANGTQIESSPLVQDKDLGRVKIAYVTQPLRKPTLEMVFDRNWSESLEITSRVFTIATQLNSKGTKLNYQIASCAPIRRSRYGGSEHGGDHFDKAIGRKIALGRFGASAFSAPVPKPEFGESRNETVTRALYAHIAKNEKLPGSVRRFFERELRARWSSPFIAPEVKHHDKAREDKAPAMAVTYIEST